MITKNAFIRYKTLDKCFSNLGKMYFIEDLVEACNEALLENDPKSDGIKLRSVQNDIKFMESESGYSIPLERHSYGKRFFYRYETRDFSITKQPIQESELNAIKESLQILSRFSGLPQFDYVNELIPKISNGLGLDSSTNSIIGFDDNVDYTGRVHIGTIYEAIVQKQVLKISYQDFRSEEPYDIIFHPYYLKQYNNRWFAFGKNNDNNLTNWNLALDRIQRIEQSSVKYFEHEEDWEDYFSDLIGVTRFENSVAIEVKLLFSKAVAPYVLSKPIHQSQKIKKIESGLEVRINVVSNYELKRLILSYGGQVQVISPKSLFDEIGLEASKMSYGFKMP
jgi:predicted DNA-binding transcriptional regulator YafY